MEKKAKTKNKSPSRNLEDEVELLTHALKDLVIQAQNIYEENSADTLNSVIKNTKKHPIKALGIACAVGFFIGRIFKR